VEEIMNIKVNELMTESVVTTEPHVKVERVRAIIEKNRIGALPVVDGNGQPVGIVSATDLVASLKPESPVNSIMTEKVQTIPQYEDVSIAARVMRNHKIHHLVVTHEQKVVGVLSAFDLLKLVEDHRYVAKNPPSGSKRKGSKRS
jgi:IMP dehydrogenase